MDHKTAKACFSRLMKRGCTTANQNRKFKRLSVSTTESLLMPYRQSIYSTTRGLSMTLFMLGLTSSRKIPLTGVSVQVGYLCTDETNQNKKELL